MRHHDSWHFLRSLTSHLLPSAACHCGVPCMCTWGLLSAMSLNGCNEASVVPYKNRGAGGDAVIGIETKYLPSSGTNCLEDDIPPPNCH